MTSLIDSQEAGKIIPALLWSSSSSHSRVVLVRIYNQGI